ncbi:MAG: HEPN domain-containing protein [Cellulosilyticum sp.]|nr:HEPN domain-containing protein [Cellulosilyticum sp.]
MPKKGSMLYFAELDYKHILHIQHIEGLEDSVLVTCQQCIEKYLKHLISSVLGETEKSHNLPFLISKLSGKYPELKQYNTLARFLKDCYFERRYENEDYVELEPEEYQNYVKESLEMIQYLQGLV